MRNKLANLFLLFFLITGVGLLGANGAWGLSGQSQKTKKSQTASKSKSKKTKAKKSVAKTAEEDSTLKGYAAGTVKAPAKPQKVRAADEVKKEKEIITTFGGKTRIDFQDMLIEGQTKKADTVYLFERTESKIDSLVKVRKDFRKEIMESYLD